MKTKIMRLLLFSSILLLFNVAAMGNDKDLPQEIFKHWIDSHEEDTKDVAVFRPSGYNFPPARGRSEFEIKQNGEFVLYRIAPACGLEKFSGHWKAEGKGKIIAYFENNEVVSYTINIISCTNDLLKIMK
mgnify:CR=1 FL=1